MADTKTLYTLQRVESKIDAIKARITKIDRLIASDRELQAALSAHEKTLAEQQKWQTKQTDLDLKRKSLKEEADSTEERLYSGRVTNPRELSDLQEKLAELKKRHQELEDPILEAMEKVETLTDETTEKEAALAKVREDRAESITRLTDERERLASELAKYQRRSKQVREKIEPDVARLFDALRIKLNGVAVVAMQDGICRGCGVEIEQRMAQKVRHGMIRQCNTCERILYDAASVGKTAPDESSSSLSR